MGAGEGKSGHLGDDMTTGVSLWDLRPECKTCAFRPEVDTKDRLVKARRCSDCIHMGQMKRYVPDGCIEVRNEKEVRQEESDDRIRNEY
jgi:hypothetical protein